MPARDGTGPGGQGAKTGRGLGNCSPVNQQYDGSTRQNPDSFLGWFGRLWGNRSGQGARRGRRNRISRR